MATGTVEESEEERKREEAHVELRRELVSAAARYVRSELARSGSGSRDAALLDWRLRSEALEAMRQGLELVYGKDGAAPAPCPACGGRTRLLRVEKARVETVLGSARVEMARRQCRDRDCSHGGRSLAAVDEGCIDAGSRGAAVGQRTMHHTPTTPILV